MIGGQLRNEKTSHRVAAIAGRILQRIEQCDLGAMDALWCYQKPAPMTQGTVGVDVCTVADLKTMAASCLTQTADRPAAHTARKPKKKARRK